MSIRRNLSPFTCTQEEAIVRSLQELGTDGFLAHNILMTDPGLPRFPNEHDVILLLPWAAYTIESKKTSFAYVKLPGNSPPEWYNERPTMGRSKDRAHLFPGRENPLHIAWKKAAVLRSQYVVGHPALRSYPVQAIVIYPDSTTVETSGKETVCGIRVCNLREIKQLVMADRSTFKQAFPLDALEALFRQLEALSPELSHFVVGRIEFGPRNEKLREPGCPVRVDCFDGKDVLSGRSLDVRVYDMSFPEDATRRFLRRFKRRTAALLKLQDPNVVRVIDAQPYPDCMIVAYDHYDGYHTVREAVLVRGTLEIDVAVSFISNLASTIDRLHTSNVIHLDIRPENVLVGTRLEHHRGRDHVLTGLSNPHLRDDLVSALVYGNDFDASFVAPGLREPGPNETRNRTNDIYSLGALLTYCIAGEERYRSSLVSRKPVPDTGNKELDQIVRTATENRTELRYRSVQHFTAALRAFSSTNRAFPKKRGQ